jgi:putative toxin-antitoxin system antitoxin component (TIGR02293 family)
MKSGVLEESPQKLIARIERGVRFKDLEVLGETLELNVEELPALVGVSRATLHRRQRGGRLQPVESERVVRYEQLVGRAKDVFGGIEDAIGWLKSPQRGLGGAVPLEYARTEIGAREVEKLIGRIDYGIYS